MKTMTVCANMSQQYIYFKVVNFVQRLSSKTMKKCQIKVKTFTKNQ